MEFSDINLWSVLVAAVASMVLGALWYGPLFGKRWSKYSKVPLTEMKKAGAQVWLMGFVNTLVIAFFLAYFVGLAGVNEWGGALVGLFAAVGFSATVLFSAVLWEKRPIELLYLNSAFWILSFMLMGAMLGYMA